MKKSKLVLIMVFMLVVGIGIGAGAATLFASDQVLYKDSTTVKGALDDLYSKTSYGNATAAQILSGKTALVGGSKITGSMLDISTKKVATLTSSDTRPVLQQRRQSGDAKVWALANSDGTSRLNYEIPQVGYVPSGTIVGVPYADVAGAIGLTAAKIAKGNTILGIAGTYTGGNAKYGSLSTSAGGTYTISTGLSSISNFTIYLKDTVCGVGINMAVYSPSVLGSGYYYPSMNTSGCGGGSPGRMSVGTGDTSLYFKINSVSGGNVSITVPTGSGHYGTPSYWLAS